MREKDKSLNFLNFDKLVEFIAKFIELKFELFELKAKEQMVAILSSIATLTLIFAFGFFMLFFGSLAIGFYLNEVLESRYLGFVLVGSFYFLICIILVIFKDKIITNQLFQALFSDTLTIKKDEQDSNKQD